MTTGDAMDATVGARHDPALALPPDENHTRSQHDHATEVVPVYEGKPMHNAPIYHEDGLDDGAPTDEELHTLRRVSEKIPWSVYTIAFVELVERFSYYGTAVVCKYP
jgi:POT family proton-dependent oligopeptide transporter